MRTKTHSIISFLFIAVAFVAVYFLSSYVETHRVNLPETYEDEDLTLQGKRLKGYVLGADGLVADWYWMRSLQYIGGKIVKKDLNNVNLDDLTSLNPRLLYPLLDTSTEMDPHLIAAFTYGATILPAIDAQKAIELTEKGIEHNPNEWRLFQWLGYIYWKLGDPKKAADVYDQGGAIPGSPPFFKLMAARMRNESGSRDTAREIYKQMLSEAPDQKTKYAAEVRLMELDSLDEREAIAAAIDEFKTRNGRCPTGLRELIPQLQRVVLPHDNHFEITPSGDLADPSGAAYLYDRANCSVALDYRYSKIPPK